MGNEPVAYFLKRINFPLLAGNWDVSNESKDKPVRVSQADNLRSFNTNEQCAHWIVKTVNGVDIAIFSLALDKMADFLTLTKIRHL